MVLPNWGHIRLSIGGQPLTLDDATLLEQRRVLDMRQGVLLREWRVQDSAGRITSLRSLRFASLAQRHLLGQQIWITPENYSDALTLDSLIDGDVTNQNNARHLRVTELHQDTTSNVAMQWTSIDGVEEQKPVGQRWVTGNHRITMRTLQSGYDIAFAASAALSDSTGTAMQPQGVLEIARFWCSRAVQDDQGRSHIRTVIGPDEYHESVDDNAYTNVMAAWTLRQGAAVAAELQGHHAEIWARLRQQLLLGDDEIASWRTVADTLVTGFDEHTNLFEQFAGFYDLRPYDLSGHDTADKTMDVKLGWDVLLQTQVLKQADVVMLIFLLWEQFAPATHEANFRFYEPRTSHDSSLSPSFHALVAARLGDLPLAERYLRQAVRIDLDFGRKGWAGASGGVHIAALGGVWQALAFGFLGMRPVGQRLRFVPHVPAAWGSLDMPIIWRGRHMRIRASATAVTATLQSGDDLEIALGNGKWQTITAGKTLDQAL